MKYIKIIIFLVFSLLFCNYTYSEDEWITQIDSVYGLSSPMVADVNGDQVKDVIVGVGYEDTTYRFVSGVVALNGIDGSILWNIRRKYDIYGTAKMLDTDNDGIDEVIFVGRIGEFFAVNSKTGELKWEFFDTKNLNPLDSGWYNFFDPQIIPDINADGIKDIVITNGGNAAAVANDTLERYPGFLMIVSGRNGKLLKKLKTPDYKETYMTPLVHDFNNDGNYSVLLGTGGETARGGLWTIKLDDLMQEDSTKFRLIVSDTSKGFITAPALVDINNDNKLDIITAGFNGHIYAINGANFSVIWHNYFPGFECYTSPAIGLFNNDTIPDVAITIAYGIFSDYQFTKHLLLNGNTGTVLDSLITNGDFALSSPITGDFDYDTKDEVLFTTNKAFQGKESMIFNVIDYNDGQNYILDSLTDGFLFGSTPTITSLSTDENDTLMDVFFVETQYFTLHNDSLTNIKIHKKKYNKIQKYETNWSNFYGNDRDCKYYKNNLITSVNSTTNIPLIKAYFANGYLHLPDDLLMNNFYVNVYNTAGRLISQTTNNININLNNQPNGIYIAVIFINNYALNVKFNVVNR